MAEFDLHNFFPYQVRVYYRAVSDSLAEIYTSRFNLTVSQWRVMVVLGPDDMFSASELVDRSSLGKVTISRAIKGLQAAKLVRRDIDGNDKRRAAVRLTAKGRDILATLVPLVKAREAELFDGISPQERRVLLDIMARVQHNAAQFVPT